MHYQFWHDVIIAYRLEDNNGNSPFIVSSTKNHFASNVYPDYGDYCFAYLDMTKFLEPEYYKYYVKNEYSLYEYLLQPEFVATNFEGAVFFRSVSVRSKSKIKKGRVQNGKEVFSAERYVLE